MADMRMQRRSGVVLFFGLFAVFCLGSCSDQVPVVIWSSQGSVLQSQTAPVAGHIVSSSQLVSYLSSALTSSPHNVLLFLQDKLSVDDFTMHGGVFGNKQDNAFPNLESALESAPSSLVLPAVDWHASSAVPALLQEKLGISPLYLDPNTLSQLRLNDTISSLLVIRLPYSTGTDLMSPKEVLSGNDEVIGQVLNVMKTQAVPYTAVYTALRPSRVIREVSLAVESLGRSLLQAPAKAETPYPPVMFNGSSGPCILLWAKNITLSWERSRDQWVRLDLGPMTFGASANVSLSDSSCNQTNSRLVLHYGNIQDLQNFRVVFVMSSKKYPVSAREWFTLDRLEIESSGQKATFNASRNIYAPRNYSFHCATVTSFRDPLLVPSSDSASKWRVSFSDFQIQGFNVVGPNFSYASDCASFFTPGIWMGLLTSLLLVLILTYGLHMIMQLKTMDRFDDPKGPSISVPQNE
ncbi:V-type proton ATPase subunit S1 [Lepisosteus oculatus]|uniref:V-type proton ATPase subunit S1 n=1 Tax=Lepisosteus oculatus TaxID=7918 RepID=UPI0035F5038B